MASQLSREKAAQAWCTPKTSHIVMDVELAGAFAEILDEIWILPWLGNATSKEMVEELWTRFSMGELDPDYKTVQDLTS